MKKTLVYVLITLVQVFLAVVRIYQPAATYFAENMPFICDAARELCKFYKDIGAMLHLADLGIQPKFVTIVSCAICFVIETIVWYLVFGLIGLAIKKAKIRRRKKLMKHPYELTEEEKARFDSKMYLRHFPTKRVISMLIPLAVLAFFFLVRFDTTICAKYKSNNQGLFTIWSDYLKPFTDNFKIGLNGRFYGIVTKPYGWIDLANKYIPQDLLWVEYVVFAVAVVLVLVVWFLLFTLLGLPFRKSAAKRRAKRAEEKYFKKMAKSEEEALSDNFSQISKKSSVFLGYEGTEVNESLYKPTDDSIRSIAAIHRTENEGLTQDVLKHADYIDDLSEGVIDLGVNGNAGETENKAPVVEREVAFVDEKEIDIVLDKEPVIEVPEEEEIENEVELEEDPFFEKYQAEYVDVNAIAELGDSKVLKVYEEVEEKEPSEAIVIKEFVYTPVEEPKEESKPIVEKVEVKEEPKVVEPIVEEPAEEPEEVVEEVVEEKPRPNIKPIAVVRGEKQEAQQEEKEFAKPIDFKPTGQTKKNIKPIDLEKRKQLELKKYVSSNTKVGGNLTPTEAFNTGTTRVASVIRPMSLNPVKKISSEKIPVVSKPEDYKEEKPFENAHKKMINPIIVRHDEDNNHILEKKGEEKKAIKPIQPIKPVELAKKTDEGPKPEVVKPIKPLKPQKKELKKPIKPVDAKKK